MDLEKGDRVKILRCPEENSSYAERHTAYEGKIGIIEKVDNSDNTVSVNIDGNGHWFKSAWVVKSGTIEHCSCGGPETIVHILFKPVKVCKKCKREKP